MKSDFPEVTSGVATVYWYGNRRFLTKRAAYAAKARDMMRGDDHRKSETDTETGAFDPCQCFACEDAGWDFNRDGGSAHKAITRALMRGEPIPAEYASNLAIEVPASDGSGREGVCNG